MAERSILRLTERRSELAKAGADSSAPAFCHPRLNPQKPLFSAAFGFQDAIVAITDGVSGIADDVFAITNTANGTADGASGNANMAFAIAGQAAGIAFGASANADEATVLADGASILADAADATPLVARQK